MGMEPIGTAAEMARRNAQDRERSPYSLPDVSSQTFNPHNLPASIDKFCDIEATKLVCFRGNDGKWEIRRELSDDERQRLKARAELCDAVLMPFSFDENQVVFASIAGLLTGFRSLRGYEPENAIAQIEVTMAVLREFPAWAIAKACIELARKQRAFPPNDGEICEAVAEQVRLYRASLQNCVGLLSAAVQKPLPPAGSSTRPPGPPQRRLPAPLTPERAQAIAAECEARRLRHQDVHVSANGATGLAPIKDWR